MQIVKERNDLLLLGSKSSRKKQISFFLSLRFMGQLCATNERVSMKLPEICNKFIPFLFTGKKQYSININCNTYALVVPNK